MKTFRKALSVILGLAIMLSCVMGMQVSVAAEEATEVTTLDITVGDATAADGTVTVPVSVDANPGFTSLGIEVTYDAAVLKLTGAEKNTTDFPVKDSGACSETLDTNPYVMMWAFAEEKVDVATTGTIATLTFEVLDDTAENTKVSVEVTEAWNFAGDDVAATATTNAGTVDLVKEPEVPECEHTNITFVSSILPTTTTDGKITLNCENCGEYTVDLFYNKYARAGYSSANAEEQTLISFSAFYKKDFTRIDANASWDEMFIVVNQSRNGEAIGSQTYTYSDVEIGVSNGEDAYKVYYGLPAYAYVDDMAANVYLYDSVADKWYSGPENKTSLKALAESIIPSATGIKKSMWVDLLNYGAAAQKNFHKNEDNLANADIDAYQSAATTPKAYTNNLSVSAGSDPTPFYYYMFTGVVESKITLRTYFRFPNNYSGMYAGENGENIKAVATWTSYTGETKTYEATLGEDGFNLLEGRNDRWDFYLPLGAPDLRANVTFTIVYGEEEIVVSPVATCSFESYVADNYASGNAEFKALCDAMMAFGDSANAYLTQN